MRVKSKGGAPRGNRNALKSGGHTAASREFYKALRLYRSQLRIALAPLLALPQPPKRLFVLYEQPNRCYVRTRCGKKTPLAAPSGGEGKVESKRHHCADAFAGMHQVERLVDVLQRQQVGDEIVDVELAVHVPVDDLRHIGAAARAAERGAFPHPPGYQLKRPRPDLLPCARHADDDALAPAAVAAFQRRPHEI